MTVLDPDRVYRAGLRAKEAAEQQEYHLAQAAVAAAKVQTICETWGLDPITFKPAATTEG